MRVFDPLFLYTFAFVFRAQDVNRQDIPCELFSLYEHIILCDTNITAVSQSWGKMYRKLGAEGTRRRVRRESTTGKHVGRGGIHEFENWFRNSFEHL